MGRVLGMSWGSCIGWKHSALAFHVSVVFVDGKEKNRMEWHDEDCA